MSNFDKKTDEPDAPDAPVKMGNGPSAATTIARLALEEFDLVRSLAGDFYAVPKQGPRLARPLRGGGSLRAVLSRRYRDTRGGVPSQQALADALATLEGYALDADEHPMPLRVWRDDDGAVWLDLGDTDALAVYVDRDGWQVRDDGPLFRRTGLTGTLPEPVPDGHLDELWELLNITQGDRPLVLAWLVAALLEDIPHPILALRGEQGTGKTSASRTLVRLLDPGPVETRKPPKDVEAWIGAAAASYVVAVDNVSTVPDWWSDSLCRAVTGDGDVRRRLYTDDGTHVVKFRRVMMLNGIDLGGALRDDLAERLLAVDLERIDPTRRLLDRDLAKAWQAAHPRILGALLDLLAQVLDVLDDLELTDLARMADFDRVLAAVDQVLGTEGRARYVGRAAEVAADTLDGDQVLAAIVAAVTEPFTGTAVELLDLITPDAAGWRAPKGWPADSAALSRHLRRRSPSLRKLGWTVDDLGRGGKAKALRWSLLPAEAGKKAGGGQWRADSDLLSTCLFEKEREKGPTPPPPAVEGVAGEKARTLPAVPALPAEQSAQACARCDRPLLLARPGRTVCAMCEHAERVAS